MATLIPLQPADTIIPPAVAAGSGSGVTLIPLTGPSVVPQEMVPPADIPEITAQTQIPWHQRIGVDAKLMMTSEPWEKARIIAKSFPDRAELMYDTETNEPIITLDGSPYVVNKRGLSAQDLNDFVAETGAYLPASILSGGTSILTRLGLGALTYATTETVREVGTYAAGGKSDEEGPIDFADVGTVGAVGGTAEALLPPVLKIGGRAVRSLFGANAPNMSDDVLDAVIAAMSAGDETGAQKALQLARGADSGGIPLTVGQQTGNRSALETEAMMRESTQAYGEQATDVIHGADAAQMGRITQQAEGIQQQLGAGSGFGPDVFSDIGSRLQSDIITEEAKRKAAAVVLGDTAREAVRDTPAYVPVDIISDGLTRMLAAPGERGINAFTRSTMPLLDNTMKRLRTFQKAADRGKFTAANYGTIMDFKKGLQSRINSVGAHSEEGAIMIEMKNILEGSVDDAMTRGLILGDDATIGLVKDSNKVWRDYFKDFTKAAPDKRGNVDIAGSKLGKILGGETPENVASFFASVSKNAPKKETRELFGRVETIFGKDSEQVKLIKDAVIYKLFTNSNRRGSADITRNDIVKNFTEFFVKNKSMSEVMFKPEEVAMIRQFVGNVARSMPAEMLINPSGSGKFIARLFSSMGEGGFLASMTSKVPFVGGPAGGGYARALAYADRITSAPWGAAATGAAAKDEGSAANATSQESLRYLQNLVSGNQ